MKQDQVTRTVNYKGITITRTFISATTGRTCTTPQGWHYQVAIAPLPGSWAGSLKDAQYYIDMLIEKFNAGRLRDNTAAFIEKTIDAPWIFPVKRNEILAGQALAREREAQEEADDARANRVSFALLPVEAIASVLSDDAIAKVVRLCADEDLELRNRARHLGLIDGGLASI